jgi:hypothetical protein
MDGRSLTFTDAILRHGGDATHVIENLSPSSSRRNLPPQNQPGARARIRNGFLEFLDGLLMLCLLLVS